MKLLTAILSMFSAVSAHADLDAGIQAYHQGDYKTAKKEFSAAAEA